MAHSPALIGSDGLLLHIGPHKSGTSAIQSAMHRASAELASHDVLVPGRHRLQSRAARAVTEMNRVPGMPPGTAEDWDTLVRKARAHGGRVLISSEYFDAATPEQAARITHDLNPERLHIVITAAPLASVLPSNWQQLVRVRTVMSFEDWLHQVFDRLDEQNRTIFWRRQRLDWQVDLWREAVGIDRVHLVIGDKSRPRQLFDGFEDLLGVPRGTLQSQGPGTNRSLRWSEVELLRQLNIVAKREGWDDATHARFARLGAARGMLARTQFGAGDDDPIRLPSWAHERATDVATQMVDRLRASGVHVVGDLATLLPSAQAVTYAGAPVTEVSLDVAVHAVMGTARAGGAGILREKHVGPENLHEYPGVSSAPTALLEQELAKRGKVPKSLANRGKVPRTLDEVPASDLLAQLRRRAKRRLSRR